MLNKLLQIMHNLEELAREYEIEGVSERMEQATFNYQIAHWRDYDRHPSMLLLEDALAYGCDVISEYIQKCEIKRQYSMEEDDWQYRFPIGGEETAPPAKSKRVLEEE